MAVAGDVGAERLWFGCGVVIAAGAILSLGAFCIRLAGDMSPWVYVFWRSVGLLLTLSVISVFWRGRDPIRQLTDLGPTGWIGATFLACTAATFLLAVSVATLAEVFFLCSLAPLIAAALAYPVLGERLGWGTLCAIALALVGFYLVAGGVLPVGGSIAGKILAIASALSFAGYTLATRRALAKDLDGMLIAFGLISLVIGIVGSVLTGAALFPGLGSVMLAGVHGGVVLVAGLSLIGVGSRHVGAITLTMLAQTETVLAPLWGYLFFDEKPAPIALLGGVIILIAVVLQAVAQAAGAGRMRARNR